jgi:tetratricopeptide (TPR) repeat protein
MKSNLVGAKIWLIIFASCMSLIGPVYVCAQTSAVSDLQSKHKQADLLFAEAKELISKPTVESMQAAIPKFEIARQMYHEINSRQDEALCLMWLGHIAKELGKGPEALEYYNQALLIYKQTANVELKIR